MAGILDVWPTHENNMENKALDTTVLVAAFTAVAYICAYAFETAYLSHFGVPAEFAEVNLRSIMLGGAALAGTGLLIGFQGFLYLLPSGMPRGPLARIIRNVLFVVLAIALINVFDVGRGGIFFIMLMVAPLVAGDLLLPLIRFRGQNLTYVAKLQKAIDSDKDSAFDDLARSSSMRGYVAAFALLCFVVPVAYMLGLSTAKRKADFLISGNCIALRVQGDILLCAEWDGRLTGAYRYMPSANARLTMERIGPLPRYRHEVLMPIVRKAPKAPSEEVVDANAVADGNSTDDTMNLPEPQAQQ